MEPAPIIAPAESIFLSVEPEVLVSAKSGVAWTEGPQWFGGRLLFSDTVEGSLWTYSKVSGPQRVVHHAGGCPGPSSALEDGIVTSRHEEELRKGHTYCPDGQLEPGPNGNILENRTGLIVHAQHGGRRVVRRNTTTLDIVDVIASSFGGVPLNSPNDLAIHPADGSIHFTDPFYGFLETSKLPLGDHKYTSDKSALGYAGVYRVPAPDRIGAADPHSPILLTAELERPNGIGFEPMVDATGGQHAMWVSECCQGHAHTCPSNTARWVRFLPADPTTSTSASAGGHRYVRNRTVTWSRPVSGGGCADGFKLLARPGRSTLLVGACPMGVCVVDTTRTGDGAVVEYVEFTHRTSNVVLGGDDHLYVTGEGHLWRLPLASNVFDPPFVRPTQVNWGPEWTNRDEL